MSRTFRTPSKYRVKIGKNSSTDKLRDGSYTHVRRSCENGGSCPHCQNNRQHKFRRISSLEEELLEYEERDAEDHEIFEIKKDYI